MASSRVWRARFPRGDASGTRRPGQSRHLPSGYARSGAARRFGPQGSRGRFKLCSRGRRAGHPPV